MNAANDAARARTEQQAMEAIVKIASELAGIKNELSSMRATLTQIQVAAITLANKR